MSKCLNCGIELKQENNSELEACMLNWFRITQDFLEKLNLSFKSFHKNYFKDNKNINNKEQEKQISKGEENEFWELISFINAVHGYRKRILLELKKGPQTKRQLDSSTNIIDCRKVLTSLAEKELIICKTPNRKIGKMYAITEKGEKLIQVMERVKEFTENG